MILMLPDEGSHIRVVPGVDTPQALPAAVARRVRPSVEEIVAGVREGNRGKLAQAITLIESGNPARQAEARHLVRELLPFSGKARRIGITGVPGVGKSTFIEALGCQLCDAGHKLAVLAIDPTSSVTGGSILGDKTRMEHLSRREEAFIRPSPSGRGFGGVARATRETIIACEAAGFDVIIVETVGVGQGETTVRSMVDFFLLLLLPGGGDELQGIKRGIVELADAVVVNKADGDQVGLARRSLAEYAGALHVMRPPTPGWTPFTGLCSALEGSGLNELWDTVDRFYGSLGRMIARRRREQELTWLHDLIQLELTGRFYRDPAVQAELRRLEAEVEAGRESAATAAEGLIQSYFNRNHQPHA